jgi:hypothetical protein
MTVPVGEPDASPNSPGSIPGFTPSGLPTCFGDLETGKVGCTGLVPGARYNLGVGRRVLHPRADLLGEIVIRLGIRRGDQVVLSNGATKLTTLHVARLQVHILGGSRHVSGGRCSPGEYLRGPLLTAPTNGFAGEPSELFGGTALTGVICLGDGNPQGLTTRQMAQTDERSGGATITDVRQLIDISPVEGETLYGKFMAVAQPDSGQPPVSLRITKASGLKPVFVSHNVDKRRGVPVSALPTGSYTAYWTVRDRNGDSRQYVTRFVEERPPSTSRHQHG